eukprot:6167887-Pleurochrysis_carterae.AAC.1
MAPLAHAHAPTRTHPHAHARTRTKTHAHARTRTHTHAHALARMRSVRTSPHGELQPQRRTPTTTACMHAFVLPG